MPSAPNCATGIDHPAPPPWSRPQRNRLAWLELAPSGGGRRSSAWQNLRQRIVALAWPVLIGQLSVVAFSTVDTVLVARHSPLDLAALSVGASAYITIFIGLMGVVLALGPIVGQLFGAGQLRRPAGSCTRRCGWRWAVAAGQRCCCCFRPFLALARLRRGRGQGARLPAALAWLPASLLFAAYRGFNNAVSRPKAVMALQVSAPGAEGAAVGAADPGRWPSWACRRWAWWAAALPPRS
jgi:MATE family multidrug resistance protein